MSDQELMQQIQKIIEMYWLKQLSKPTVAAAARKALEKENPSLLRTLDMIARFK